jgi:hypothetical protein
MIAMLLWEIITRNKQFRGWIDFVVYWPQPWLTKNYKAKTLLILIRNHEVTPQNGVIDLRKK